jgi:protein involved in polysaccharide export with SLBB domain
MRRIHTAKTPDAGTRDLLVVGRSFCSAIALISILAGCASVTATLPPPPQVGLGPPKDLPAYRLQPGDVIELHILSNPELNEQVIVAPDSRVTFQFAPNLTVGGRSLQQVTDMLNTAYGTTTKNDLQVVLRSQVGTRVYVTGEVLAPTEVIANGEISALGAVTRAESAALVCAQPALGDAGQGPERRRAAAAL